MSTCRVCGEHAEYGPKGPLVHYSVRHYAHAKCAMERWGGAFFDRLTPWQASRFPALFALRAGQIGALEKRVADQPGK